jgi:hypothetical protein
MFQIQQEAVEPDATQPGNNQDGDKHEDDLQPAPNALSSGYSEDINILAVSSYRAPDVILDLLMNPADRNFFQRIPSEAYAADYERRKSACALIEIISRQ